MKTISFYNASLNFQVFVMRLSTHHDAQTVVWGGWGPIVDIHVHMEIKYQWIVVYVYVMLVMLVRYFNYELRARC